jgi:hypothetical protein
LSPRTGLSFLAYLSGAFPLYEISRHATREKSGPRKAAMPVRGLTVGREDIPVFLRLSADQRGVVASLAGQFKSFPQNMYVTPN